MALGNDTWAGSSAALAPTLMDEFPEVNAATRFRPVDRLLLTKEDNSLYERGLYTDEYFFDVFSFPLIKGDKNRILDSPESIVISERLAMKFFGTEDPMGKTLNCAHGDLEVRPTSRETIIRSFFGGELLIIIPTVFLKTNHSRKIWKIRLPPP